MCLEVTNAQGGNIIYCSLPHMHHGHIWCEIRADSRGTVAVGAIRGAGAAAAAAMDDAELLDVEDGYEDIVAVLDYIDEA